MARPLDPFTLPPNRPTSSIAAPSIGSPGTRAAVGATNAAIIASAAAVVPNPVSSTGRSPQRSVSKPQGNSLSAMPSPRSPSTKAELRVAEVVAGADKDRGRGDALERRGKAGIGGHAHAQYFPAMGTVQR